jgi:hypothetical protein
MDVFTYSSARQNLSHVLGIALKRGAVAIKRRDGTRFVIRPVSLKTSPLDVKGVEAEGIEVDTILQAIRDRRKDY